VTDAIPKPAPKPSRKHGCLVTLLLLLVFFTTLSLFVEFATPIRVRYLIADQLRQSLRLRETPTVRVSLHPLLYKLVIGRVDDVYVKVSDIDAKEGFTIDSAEVQIKGVKVDMLNLLRTRQLSVERIDEGQIRVVLSEKAVNDLIGGQLPGSKVKLEKGKIAYTGDLPYLLPGFSFTVSGTVSVLPDNTLSFKPAPEDIDKLAVPQEVKDYLGDALSIDYRVLELPDGVTLTGVKVTPGQMTIEASIESLDAIIQTSVGGT